MLEKWKSYFPSAVSYHRFIEWKKLVDIPLLLFTHFLTASHRSGNYYFDATKLPVCHHRRIHSHRVVKSLAQRGKTATGWFYSLKLHLIIDPLGELISLVFSSGNKSDVKQQIILALTQKITEGKRFGDAGYLSAKLVEILIEKGRWPMSKIRKNMKNKLMPIKDKFLLKKRAIIKTVIDFLKHIFDLWHTMHRAIDNAFKPCNGLLGGLSVP
ncbi:MAG: IS982 family transposase [Bacteroidota bacterium]